MASKAPEPRGGVKVFEETGGAGEERSDEALTPSTALARGQTVAGATHCPARGAIADATAGRVGSGAAMPARRGAGAPAALGARGYKRRPTALIA